MIYSHLILNLNVCAKRAERHLTEKLFFGFKEIHPSSLSAAPVTMADLENVEMNTEEDFLGEMNAETPLVATGEANSWWSWLRKPQEPKFTKIADVEYPSRSGIQTEKHKIDIYIPKSNGANDAKAHKRPVLVHVHGGGWVRGTF